MEVLNVPVYRFIVRTSPGSRIPSRSTLSPTCSRCITAARAANGLARIYQDRWTFDRQESSDLQSLYVALFILMDNLYSPSSHDAFLNLAKIPAFAGARWLLTKGMFRKVQIATIQGKDTISLAIKKLF
ncbi:hypothetical protein BDW68DRAFT_178688 [Aspergillus falconensis]